MYNLIWSAVMLIWMIGFFIPGWAAINYWLALPAGIFTSCAAIFFTLVALILTLAQAPTAAAIILDALGKYPSRKE